MASHFSYFAEDIVKSSKVLDNEFHIHRDCMCERRLLYHGGRLYYIFYRKCVCGEYTNRFSLFEHTTDWSHLPTGHVKNEGIDIHEDDRENCTYEYPDIWGGQKKFSLQCYCGEFSEKIQYADHMISEITHI